MFDTKENNHLIDSFFSKGHVGFALLDHEFKFVRVNEQFASVEGKAAEFFIGKNFFELFLCDCMDVFIRVRDAGIAHTARAQPLPMHNEHENDMNLWDWTLEPIVDQQNTLSFLMLSRLNVSEKYALEKRIWNYQKLTNNLMCTASFDGYFLELSPSWAKLLGFSDEQLRAQPFIDFVHPEDREATILETSKLAGGQGETINFVNRYIDDQGDYHWLSWQAISDLDYGYIYATANDISALKRSEDELRQKTKVLETLVDKYNQAFQLNESRLKNILHGSPAVIYTCKAEGDFGATFISENIEQYFGYKPEAFTSDSSFWASNIHPDDAQRVFAELAQVFEHGSHSHEYRFRTQAGDYIWVHDDLRLIQDAQGRPVELIGYWADITDRKNIEEDANRARLQAEEANQSKSEFLSRMSHELRTPMNAILGFAQLIMLDKKGYDAKTNANEIFKAGNHLLELINDVLDLTKIEAGQLPISMENISLNRVLEDCFTLIFPVAMKQGIRIDDQVTAKNPIIVWADYTRLKQVLLNLMSNAVKYNREAGGITIRAELRAKEMLRITVEDTGLGIPRDMQQHLFQPFERLGAESTDIDGTGIGLVVCKHLMKIMDGEIGVESEEGVGTTFWVDIRCGDSLAQNNRTSGLFSAFNENAQGEKSATVLYVEDNPANLRLVTQIFANTTYTLLSAHTGTLGLEVAKAHQPDLIMLDINLPGLNGYKLLEKIKQDPNLKNTPVIAISANAMTKDVETGIAAGFQRYIKKPINISELLNAVQSLV
ncbi:MAG: PAS domain-containing protein [Gammaproteobacteria bacterium]|nr:PAS domain-containing protein [Gammaproteobacteria bacterium]